MATSRPDAGATASVRQFVIDQLGDKPLVLVGMMGAGKTTVGRRLASQLGFTFIDSDAEVEKAAGMPITEFFALHGEAEFRAGEARVMARILREGRTVVATGGGILLHPDTRRLVAGTAVSVWLKADADLLFARVSRRDTRPLLKTEDPRATLEKLIEERYPVYATANVTVTSRDVPHEQVAETIIAELARYFEADKATGS
ncbi:MAG: shikimate kinase [Cucumibacter sp.]